MNKKLLFLLLITFLVAFYITPKLTYRFKVNNTVKEEVLGLEKNGNFSTDIIRTNKHTFPVSWNNNLLIITTEEKQYYRNNALIIEEEDVVKISKDGGKTWTIIARSSELLCQYAVIYETGLYCLANANQDIVISKISTNGIEETKKIVSATFLIGGTDILNIYKQDNELVVIWRDRRARFPNIYAFIPIPHSAPTEFGPYLIMAGKLNLDTLEFKEYVIKYDSYEFP
ncbi:MAG: hypothetical protein HY395_01670 [Candidatus Doudnabacteria bacterium]|nr:hypothetical protein [Candidatus Doudnabacteria bacterium]